MQAHITRSQSDKIVGGVCGGLAEYFTIDPVIVRLIFVVFAINGMGLPIYLLFWVIVPKAQMHTPLPDNQPPHQVLPHSEATDEHEGYTGETIHLHSATDQATLPQHSSHQPVRRCCSWKQRWRKLPLVMLGIGVLVALEHLGLTMNIMLPAFLIIAGIILLTRSQ